MTGSVVSIVVTITGGEDAEASAQQDEAVTQAKKLADAFRDKLNGPITKLDRVVRPT